MKYWFHCLIAISSLLINTEAYPDSVASNLDFYALITGETAYLKLRETNNGTRLVEESGQLKGYSGAIGITKKALTALVYVKQLDNNVDYDGQTQAGLPINSNTGEEFLITGIKASFAMPDTFPTRSRWFLDIERYHWQRDIQAVGTITGLDETYEWWLLSAGIENSFQYNKHVWSISAALSRSYNANVEIDFPGMFDNADLMLADRWGWQLAASWRYVINQNWSTGINTYYKVWRLGKSDLETLTNNGLNAGTVFQPRIEAKNYGLNLELRFNFN